MFKAFIADVMFPLVHQFWITLML